MRRVLGEHHRVDQISRHHYRCQRSEDEHLGVVKDFRERIEREAGTDGDRGQDKNEDTEGYRNKKGDMSSDEDDPLSRKHPLHFRLVYFYSSARPIHSAHDVLYLLQVSGA
jgi:hypothetical protein